MWSIAGTSKLLPVLKRRLPASSLLRILPRLLYFNVVCKLQLAKPCAQDNINIWGCGDGALVLQFLSSLGASYNRRVAPSAESNTAGPGFEVVFSCGKWRR